MVEEGRLPRFGHLLQIEFPELPLMKWVLFDYTCCPGPKRRL
jgi:hypothetical protein